LQYFAVSYCCHLQCNSGSGLARTAV